MTTPASIGFRAKTGKAIAVALAEGAKAPQYLWRREIVLYDPEMPATGQPYHEVMELPWPRALVEVQPLVERIEAVARAVVASLLRELKRDGFAVRVIGVVGSADRPLEKIGNFHIRAHAAEGILFRRVLETAAAPNAIHALAFSEKQLPSASAAALGGTAKVTTTLKALGREAGPPWRADERAAAAAAWLALQEK
jgi:hypothetical protein